MPDNLTYEQRQERARIISEMFRQNQQQTQQNYDNWLRGQEVL